MTPAVPTPSDFAYLTPKDRYLLTVVAHGGGPGGMPSYPGASEPSGDAGEGSDLPNLLQPNNVRGEGPTYTPHPLLPSAQHLDYVQKFAGASLLGIGLVVLLILVALNPRRILRGIARGGLKRAGVEE
jgi:hypothetical protein